MSSDCLLLDFRHSLDCGRYLRNGDDDHGRPAFVIYGLGNDVR